MHASCICFCFFMMFLRKRKRVTAQGTVKIADFGVSHHFHDQDGSQAYSGLSENDYLHKMGQVYIVLAYH